MKRNTGKRMIVLLIALIVSFGCVRQQTVIVNASGKISNACAAAYAKKLNSLTKNIKIKGYSYTIIRDMNGDGVPELLYNPKNTGSTPNVWTVYTYSNKKVKKIGYYPGDLYKISGSKNRYKYMAWTGVGAFQYGYVTFKKDKVISKNTAEYIGYPTNYYVKGKKANITQYNTYTKAFAKSMTIKKRIGATDTYGIQWTAAKVKSCLQ